MAYVFSENKFIKSMDNLGAPKVLCASSVLLFPSFTWGHKIYHLLKEEENKKNTEGNNPKELRQPRHTNTGYSKKSLTQASQVVLVVKNLPANAGDVRDVGLIPGWGRSPGRRHGHPLQYSCLENPVDRRAWEATVHRVVKSQTRLKRRRTHTCKDC